MKLVFGAGGAIGGLGLGWFLGRRQSRQGTPEQPTSPSFQSSTSSGASTTLFKHGLPMGSSLRVFHQYVSSFDYRTRNPGWVLEHVNRASAFGKADRADSTFKEDTTILPHLRNRLDDFRNSGYDRGHLAPAANHKGSQEALDETFLLSNMSPQVAAQEPWVREACTHRLHLLN
ncbi:hypothetical protein CYMTET_31879 [Cymbomonas tetramitiformis]|uniref:Endonuclease n=1 Tax=Cymbomonas tetramitiformis TaxID=36881 RepID=A0AAE0KSI4_9CHLO|nr:hypothetical protein CYMTET_31879 [Cymbomonas tetramitiformis]